MHPPPELHPDASPRHICHCGRSFFRKGHLTRHQATHDRPAFTCHVCQRQFSRGELLRRHQVVHDPTRTRTTVSCDACRVLKAKCSGGTPCDPCIRRGVNCTFRPSLGRPRKVPTATRSTTVEPPIRQDDSPRPSTRSRPEDMRTAKELLSHNWLQTLSIVPSKSASTPGFRPLAAGIEGIYELLRAAESSSERSLKRLDGFQQWSAKCLEAYFKNSHLRWPILNAPSFDLAHASLPLAAAVCVIGVGMQSDIEDMERLHTLRVHDLLLQRFLHELVEPEMTLEGQAWPIETLQAVLLTLVFSLYRSDSHAASRTALLRGIFIALLRHLRMFDAEILAGHLQAHYTGTFAPYALSMREQFMRLLASAYQFDVYFGIAHGTPPLLHRQEIGSNVPTTFALWNAHGLDVFAKRLLEEPTERARIQVSAMTDDPDALASSPPLVEDVLLGLCGILQGLWALAPSRTKEDSTNAVQRAMLIEKLDSWKQELNKIDVLVDTRLPTRNAARQFLMAYRGEDDSVAEALKRVKALVQDGLVLYSSLKIHHYLSLSASELVEKADHGAEVWHPNKHGRSALACALHMLQSIESSEVSDAPTHPLVRSALSMGSTLTRRVLAAGENCECLGEEEQHATGMALQQWVEIGGPVCVDGTPLCVCRLGSWSERFEKAIEDHTFIAEVIDRPTNQ